MFRDYVRRAGHDEIFYIDSAGTIDEHAGSLPDERMRRAASGRGYRLESRARQVTVADFSEFDLVLAMDHTNLDDLQQLAGRPHGHVRLFGSFIEPGGELSVPDPYYGGMDGFELVLDMIESGCQPLLQYCLTLRNQDTRRTAGGPRHDNRSESK